MQAGEEAEEDKLLKKVQLKSQSPHKEKDFPLKVLASYRYLLFLKEKKEKGKATATPKREFNDGIAESSLTPGTGTSCSQEMLHVNQVESTYWKKK